MTRIMQKGRRTKQFDSPEGYWLIHLRMAKPRPKHAVRAVAGDILRFLAPVLTEVALSERAICKCVSMFRGFACRLALCLSVMLLSVGAYAQDDYEVYVGRALEAAKADSLEKAEQLFRKALVTSPADYRNSLVFTNLGKVQELQGKNAEAIESYSMAINFIPESVPVLMNRANLYLAMGIYDKAHSDYCRILDIAPDNTEALKYRAYVNMKEKRYDESLNDFNKVIAAEPESYSAILGKAVLYQNMNRIESAIEEMNRLIEIYPDTAEAYSVRADMEIENHQPELALLDIDKAIELEPDNGKFFLSRGYLYADMGKKKLAYLDFEKAISLGIPRYLLETELKKLK